MLVLATGFWGVSYFLLDLCLTELPPLTLNAFRFLTAFFLCWGPSLFRKLRASPRRTLCLPASPSAVPGADVHRLHLWCAVYSLSNAGFICALPVVVTPLLEWLFLRKRPDRRLAVALVLCTVGMGLMTLNGGAAPGAGRYHLPVVRRGLRRGSGADGPGGPRSAGQRPAAGHFAAGGGGLRDAGAGLPAGEALPAPDPCRVGERPCFWGCSAPAWASVIQTVQQQYTSASHVGLIFTLEPVFSAIVAYFFAHEVLQLRGYIGAALMMVSLLVMELDWKSLLRRRE